MRHGNDNVIVGEHRARLVAAAPGGTLGCDLRVKKLDNAITMLVTLMMVMIILSCFIAFGY